MDCKTARLLLEFDRPAGGEMDSEEACALEQHLDRCPECAALGRAERGFQQHVGLVMRQVAVPPDLRSRLLTRLDKERGDYYRKQAARAIRTVAALAACLLIAVFIWRMRAAEKPPLNVEALLTPFAGNRCDAQNKEEVKRWFIDTYGVEIDPPADFDYAYLLECGVVDCQGKQVPCLTFARSERRLIARVYIVSDSQFDPDSLKNSPSIPIGGGAKAEIYRPDGANFAYVILFNSENLLPFLIEKSRPAA
jgi:hypothetical protein